MKRGVTIILLAAVIAGCGRAEKSETKFRGVQDKRDYAAEAVKYLEDKDIVKALQSFDMAIRQDPRKVENYLTLGQVYLHLKQPTRAVDTFSAAVKVAPQNPDAHYLLALAEVMDNNKEQAVEMAKKSAELYMAAKDEEMFKKAVALVQGLEQATETTAQ